MASSCPIEINRQLYYRKDGNIISLWEPILFRNMKHGKWYDVFHELTKSFGQCCIEQHGDGDKGTFLTGTKWTQEPPHWNQDTLNDNMVFLDYLGKFEKASQ